MIPILDPAELAGVLSRITYRPGWELTLVDEWEGWPHPTLRIVCTVPDAYEPERSIDLGISSPVPPCTSETEFVHWVAWRLDKIERHEAAEFAHLDGQPISDPHTKDTS